MISPSMVRQELGMLYIRILTIMMVIEMVMILMRIAMAMAMMTMILT